LLLSMQTYVAIVIPLSPSGTVNRKAIPSPTMLGNQSGPGLTPGCGPAGLVSAISGKGGAGGVSSLVYRGRGLADSDGGDVGVSPCLGCMGRGSGEGVVSGEAINTSPRVCCGGQSGIVSCSMGLMLPSRLMSLWKVVRASSTVESKSQRALATRAASRFACVASQRMGCPCPIGPRRRHAICHIGGVIRSMKVPASSGVGGERGRSGSP
jgi:hypothetical protein